MPDAPEGNDFPEAAELERQIDAAGLVIVDRTDLDALPAAPGSWSALADGVQEVVEREHGRDPRYQQARRQQERIAQLLADGVIAGRLLHARAAPR